MLWFSSYFSGQRAPKDVETTEDLTTTPAANGISPELVEKGPSEENGTSGMVQVFNEGLTFEEESRLFIWTVATSMTALIISIDGFNWCPQ